MAQNLRIATSASVTRRLGDFAETDTAADISRSIELIRSIKGPAMTMIAGNHGVGKTTAVKEFCAGLGHNAIYMKAAAGEGTAWNLAKSYVMNFKYSTATFNTLAEARDVVGRMQGEERLLVIDEAQHLIQRNRRNNITGEAFCWIVDVAEDYKFDVVFCGDLSLVNFVTNTPRMLSRMRRPIIDPKVSENDIRKVVDGTGFEAVECIRSLHAVAGLTGGLRNVENIVRLAALFAGSDRPTAAHLKAAILDMRIDMRRVLS